MFDVLMFPKLKIHLNLRKTKCCVMSKIDRFEDLRCWQASRKLVNVIYLIAEEGKLMKDYETRSQIKRAALSCMSNIAEGFGKFSNKEFIRYLDIAQSSALEVKSILYILLDLKYLLEDKVTKLHQLIDETRSLTLALIKYLRNRETRPNPNT